MSIVFEHHIRLERASHGARTAHRPQAKTVVPPATVDEAPTRTLTPADELKSFARHAFVANGFGDAAIDWTEFLGAASSPELDRAARAHRSQMLARMFTTAANRLVAFARNAVAAWRQHSEARAVYKALSALDAHTLRDLGFSRSELASVAAEVGGRIERTRARTMTSAAA